MGACLCKGKKGADQKGLKGSSEEDAPQQVPPHILVATETSPVTELFPKAKYALSLRGQRPTVLQNAFDERPAELFPDPQVLSSSGVGCACKKGLKPESPNQDDFCLLQADGLSVFGVFDGHGPCGDGVADFVRDFLPHCLVRDQDVEENVENSLTEAFQQTHARLCSDATLDCKLSGTTATLIVHAAEEKKLYVANVGDVKAVLCKKQKRKLEGQELTEDHGLSDNTSKKEKKRIKDAGGELRCLKGDKQERVFLKGKIFPGLTVTRSLGDSVGSQAGISCTPKVQTLEQGPKEDWQFLLLCSDGVWQVLSVQEAIDIVGMHSANSAQKAAENLASEAWNRWIKEEENVVDDITVMCYFFNNPQRTKAEADAKEKAATTKGKKGKKKR